LFITEAGLLDRLDFWLKEVGEEQIDAADARRLRENIAKRVADSDSSGKIAGTG
jgi:hypothetical protein